MNKTMAKPKVKNLIRLSDVSRKKPLKKADTMGTRFINTETENKNIVEHAAHLWYGLEEFRKRRRRARRYHRGDQWGDLIEDPDSGQMMREEDYIRKQGRVPLKQNIVRQLVKNLMGQYRNNPTNTIVYAKNREDSAISEMVSNAIRSIHDINYTQHLDAATILEFTQCGMAVQKQRYRYIDERQERDIKFTKVNPARLFFNTDVEDPRLDDIRFIGEIHDMPLMDVIGTFAKTPQEEEEIRRIYSVDYFRDFIGSGDALSPKLIDNLDFMVTSNPGMCRVIESWFQKSEWRTIVHDYMDGTMRITEKSLKDIDQLNAQRIMEYAEFGVPQEEVPLMHARRRYHKFWYAKFLTPYGHCLFEDESPYEHKEHPYTLVLYPGIDGEVWGLIEEIIDQQRYINRAIILMDFIIGSSAKGLLLVPDSAIPYEDGKTEQDFADEWAKVNGVIVYKPKPGVEPPQQVSKNAIPVGLQELLTMQLKLSYDIAGIHQAIQGQQAKSGTPATLYAQEAQNSTLNVKDFMETFSFFKQKRDAKCLKNVLQFYQEKRALAVSDNNYAPEARYYDPSKIKGALFDLKVTQGADTPVFRQVIEDTLMNLFNAQAIDVKMLLEHSTMPYAQKLLDSINRREQEMMQQQQEMQGGGAAAPQEGQIPPEMVQGLQQGYEQQLGALNPQTRGLLNKMLNVEEGR